MPEPTRTPAGSPRTANVAVFLFLSGSQAMIPFVPLYARSLGADPAVIYTALKTGRVDAFPTWEPATTRVIEDGVAVVRFDDGKANVLSPDAIIALGAAFAVPQARTAILGGGPEDLPELYRERNPITYVNRVTAPVLIIAGENDSRCPIGQVMRYVDTLRERGGRVDVHLYGTGHHALFLEETLRQIEEELAFALRLLDPLPPGLSSPG